jgi:hypothetical protein
MAGVDFDASGLAAGDYAATLCIDSNDPTTPQLAVPVGLMVTRPDRVFSDGFDGP